MTCGPAGMRRSWIVAGLVAVSLLLAGCGSAKDLVPSGGGGNSAGGGTGAGGGGGTAGEGTVDHSSVIRGLRVCGMIDLEPLTTALRSEYLGVPKDIEPGHGLDPDGPNCTAKLTGDDSTPTYLSLGTIDVSVLPYPSAREAMSSYDTRVAIRNHMDPGASSMPLDGDWDKGTLVSGERTLVTQRAHVRSSAYAVVRRGSYLVKVSVELSATGKEPESISVHREPLRPLVVDLLTSLYDRVGSELD